MLSISVRSQRSPLPVQLTEALRAEELPYKFVGPLPDPEHSESSIPRPGVPQVHGDPLPGAHENVFALTFFIGPHPDYISKAMQHSLCL